MRGKALQGGLHIGARARGRRQRRNQRLRLSGLLGVVGQLRHQAVIAGKEGLDLPGVQAGGAVNEGHHGDAPGHAPLLQLAGWFRFQDENLLPRGDLVRGDQHHGDFALALLTRTEDRAVQQRVALLQAVDGPQRQRLACASRGTHPEVNASNGTAGGTNQRRQRCRLRRGEHGQNGDGRIQRPAGLHCDRHYLYIVSRRAGAFACRGGTKRFAGDLASLSSPF